MLPPRLRPAFADLCRSVRLDLDITQNELARAAGISRAYLGDVEAGRANPTLDVVDRLAASLGVELGFDARRPIVIDPPQRDLAHARCSAYVHRRLQALGFDCRREVEIVDGRSHGWIDLLAFERRAGLLLVIEVKTSILDIGAVERQLGWYERHGPRIARQESWPVRAIRGWLLCLATGDVDDSIGMNREALQVAFPLRAGDLRAQIAGKGVIPPGRGLALIDPSRRRRDWLLPSRPDGRRSAAPYSNPAQAIALWRGDGPQSGGRR
ncbi:MAG: XRE family transcriptional regulator [Chloroflexota bacterium]|nr:MAG: XRE family transcriptional regulator [Chloroflexota bacterium]